jgi:hypothetical protein
MRENVPFSLIAGRQADLLLLFQGGGLSKCLSMQRLVAD